LANQKDFAGLSNKTSENSSQEKQATSSFGGKPFGKAPMPNLTDQAIVIDEVKLFKDPSISPLFTGG